MPISTPTRASTDRSALRTKIRLLRRALTPRQQRQHAQDCARQLLNHPAFRNAERIAAYLPIDGELDTAPLIERAWEMGKRVYLPVLLPHGAQRLWFARYTPNTHLRCNRFGIPEPAHATRTRIAPLSLDLVLTPLVAFDAHGHRLGMGGGFYDRSFAYLLQHKYWLQPRLIGLAHDFQQQPCLTRQSWDVPLHAIVTNRSIYHCR